MLDMKTIKNHQNSVKNIIMNEVRHNMNIIFIYNQYNTYEISI
jgi:hypothetical protein